MSHHEQNDMRAAPRTTTSCLLPPHHRTRRTAPPACARTRAPARAPPACRAARPAPPRLHAARHARVSTYLLEEGGRRRKEEEEEDGGHHRARGGARDALPCRPPGGALALFSACRAAPAAGAGAGAPRIDCCTAWRALARASRGSGVTPSQRRRGARKSAKKWPRGVCADGGGVYRSCS